MNSLKRMTAFALPIAGMAFAVTFFAGKSIADENPEEAAFPRAEKNLFPRMGDDLQVAYGPVDDNVLEQPIAYSHMLHAGTLEIDCQYCHVNARRSIHAGVPATQICMNCHSVVGSEGRPELEKLKEYYANGEEIPWQKVHDVPDFVHFSHKRHVQGGVECEECHGDVRNEMTVAYRVSELTMGWCLDCHENHPKVDENYGAEAELRRAELKDCWTCHK